MSSFLRNIIRVFCLMLTMLVFVFSVQADDVDDDASFDVELGYTTITQQSGYSGPETATLLEHHEKQTQMLPEHQHNKKFQVGKHISVQLFISFDEFSQAFCIPTSITHTPVIPPAYSYLYFREINPPPPKSC